MCLSLFFLISLSNRTLQTIPNGTKQSHFNMQWAHHPHNFIIMARIHPLHFLSERIYWLVSIITLTWPGLRRPTSRFIISKQWRTIAGELIDWKSSGSNVYTALDDSPIKKLKGGVVLQVKWATPNLNFLQPTSFIWESWYLSGNDLVAISKSGGAGFQSLVGNMFLLLSGSFTLEKLRVFFNCIRT